MQQIKISNPTYYVLQWIHHNGYEKSFSLAKNVDELKKIVAYRLKPLSESFKKGARLVDWNKVLKHCQEVNNT